MPIGVPDAGRSQMRWLMAFATEPDASELGDGDGQGIAIRAGSTATELI